MCVCLCVIFTLSKFPVYNIESLTIITTLYIRFPEHIHLITEICILGPIFLHFSSLSAPGNHQVTLCSLLTHIGESKTYGFNFVCTLKIFHFVFEIFYWCALYIKKYTIRLQIYTHRCIMGFL